MFTPTEIAETALAEVAQVQLHTHDFVTPVFTERKSDAHLILTGMACECRELLELDF